MRVFIEARPALQQGSSPCKTTLAWAYVGQLVITTGAVAEHNSLRDREAALDGRDPRILVCGRASSWRKKETAKGK